MVERGPQGEPTKPCKNMLRGEFDQKIVRLTRGELSYLRGELLFLRGELGNVRGSQRNYILPRSVRRKELKIVQAASQGFDSPRAHYYDNSLKKILLIKKNYLRR